MRCVRSEGETCQEKVKNRVLSRDSLAYKLLNFKEMSAAVPIIVLLIIGIAINPNFMNKANWRTENHVSTGNRIPLLKSPSTLDPFYNRSCTLATGNIRMGFDQMLPCFPSGGISMSGNVSSDCQSITSSYF